ncbi:MAG: 50S ribosomal protein L21 [Pseudomonadota bacterium]
MFAVIKAGGKQYKVKPDDVIMVNRLAANEGEIVTFEKVVLYNDGSKTQLGTPTLAGAVVAGRVIEQARGPKVIAFKKRRRKNSRRKRGHKQELSVVQITEILTGGKKPDLTAAKPVSKPKKSAKTSPDTSHGEEDMAKAKKTAKKKPAKKVAKKPAKKATRKTTKRKSTAKKGATKARKPAKRKAAKRSPAKRKSTRKTKKAK